MMKTLLVLMFTVLLFCFGYGQTSYKMPPKEIVEILDSPPTPLISISPRMDAMMSVSYDPHPSIELLAQPILRIGGVRINPVLNSRQRTTQYTGISIKRFDNMKEIGIIIPPNLRIGIPVWSYDGKMIAFARDAQNGVELWVADVASGKSRQLPGVLVNDILGSPMRWMSDSKKLLVQSIVSNKGKAPSAPTVPSGPIIDETIGKMSRTPTYQDLLKDAHDESLFAYYAQSQLIVVDAISGKKQNIGEPGIYSSAEFSPDEEYILVTKMRKPFSYRVPYYYFTRSSEVWNKKGIFVHKVADSPVSDEIPSQGVPTGPRSLQWQEAMPSSLLWVEALDEGNPTRKVSHRDKLMKWDASVRGEPTEVAKLEHRFAGIEYAAKNETVIISEINRDKRWRTSYVLDIVNPAGSKKVLFDLSINDNYNDPGRPVQFIGVTGSSTLLQDGDWIYLSGRGASEKGDRPFIDKLNLSTLQKERLFQSREDELEQFVTFVENSRTQIITRRETKSEVPNYFLVDIKSGQKTLLTKFKDPAPQLTGIQKELIRYYRPDGVPLSGTLYLPPDYQKGTRLPTLIWAYPLEYSDPGLAGQVRSSPNAFTFLRGASPLFYLTQGYAVLMDATMPVVGDAETMNDTFVEQTVAAAKAAIDKLDSLEVSDRDKMFVSGHSYGAFMTANLLAHSDLFAAGIARSGAYNRTLTPFGFQSERRSFWEARDTYMRVSPFSFANKINEPILLIHGAADNNQGTHPIQSERLYQAISGHGGTVRLVVLPHESHGYAARESVLHTLAEMMEWADKYVKNRKLKSDQ